MKKLGILHISDVHINAFSISEIDLLVDKHHFTKKKKKNIVQDFLMYNEFDPKHYKGK